MIFSKRLGSIGGRTAQSDIQYIANHIRVMQEELEYRLAHLDSQNITEIDMGQTKIYSGDVDLLTLIKDNDKMSSIQQSVDEILLTVQGQEGQISTLQQSADEIALTVVEQGVSLAQLRTDTNSISATVADLETGMGHTLTLDDEGFIVESSDGSVVLISGGQIDAEFADISGTLNANRIKLYSSMAVYKSRSSSISGGELGYTTSSLDGSAGMHMISEGEWGEVVVTDNGAKMMYGDEDNQIYIAGGDAAVVVSGYWYDFYAGRFLSEDEADLGRASYPWDTIYANSCECCTSDRNKKNSIEDLPEKYVAMLSFLTPRRFMLNSGTSGRYHAGFIAQEVEEAMTAAGITDLEFGGFIKDEDEDGNEIYMLRYSEFIAILVAKVQQMQGEIDDLKARIT